MSISSFLRCLSYHPACQHAIFTWQPPKSFSEPLPHQLHQLIGKAALYVYGTPGCWHQFFIVFLCIAGHSTFKFQHFLAILGYSPGLVRCVNAWALLRWKLGGFHTARRYPEPHTEEQLRQSQFRPRRMWVCTKNGLFDWGNHGKMMIS